MNGEYDLNRDLFFQLEESGRRGHDKTLFKRRFKLDIIKCALWDRVIDNWNSLSAGRALIVIPLTLLRSISRLNWNLELYTFIVNHLRQHMAKACAYSCIVCETVTLLASVNSVKKAYLLIV